MSAWASGPPKLSPAPAPVAEWLPGSVIKLLTAEGATLEGEVFAHDKAADLLVLKAPAATAGESAMHLVCLSSVKEVLQRTPPPATFSPEPLPELDEARAARRLEEALRVAEAASERIGLGVSRDAQALFDAISKTHPCRWRDKSIVVMEDCLIAEPYTPEVVTGGSAAACERVKTVLQHERARLNLVAA